MLEGKRTVDQHEMGSALQKAVLRKWQGCGKLDSMLRTARNGFHGYLQPDQMASLSSRESVSRCPLVPAVSAQLPSSVGDDVRSSISRRLPHHLPPAAALQS